MKRDYTKRYLKEVGGIARKLKVSEIEKMVDLLSELRNNKGRLFFIGVGGGAGNSTHAVNDFRKIAGIEAYTPLDNVSELTARVNDDGWETVLVNWLKGSSLNSQDGVFVFSVGGGSEKNNISTNIVEALKYAQKVDAKVFGVVGRDGGYTARIANSCIIVPTMSPDTVTPNTESFQSTIWHLLVSHPKLKLDEMKWEAVSDKSLNRERKADNLHLITHRMIGPKAIFIDSSDIKEIKKYLKMGIIQGVTTNPTILLKDGVTGGMKKIEKITIEIAELIYPYPLSIEVTTNKKREMINQAREFSQWSDNINIKITFHGPKGEMENLEVIHVLEQQYNIRVNATAMMNAQQCFLAALSGATYVSIFGGRVNDMGYNCINQIRKLRKLLDEYKLNSKIIIGSTREVLNVVEWLSAGAHIITVTPKLIEKMIIHPYTKETVQMFLDDAKKI